MEVSEIAPKPAFEDQLLKVNEFFPFTLREEQVSALRHIYDGYDTFVVLPTGFGKSIIYQALPILMEHVYHPVVIVVSPLNSIIYEQIQKLSGVGIPACHLSYKGTVCTEEEDREGVLTVNETDDTSLLIRGYYRIVFAHPEALVSSKTGLKILQNMQMRKNIVAIVVDEAHCVQDWGLDFRLDYGNLGELTAHCPGVPVVALTGTASEEMRNLITCKLCMLDPRIVQAPCDRPNIKLSVKRRPSNKDILGSYEAIAEPIADGLKEMREDYPLTVIYCYSLFACGEVYDIIEYRLRDQQYHTTVERPTVKQRLFAQYHKMTTATTKQAILQDLSLPVPKIRLIIATVALGMGLDVPGIRQVIHIRPPTTLIAYFQAIGRAGRDGQPASATLYYNNEDIASNTKTTEGMRKYVLSQSCYREKILRCLNSPRIPSTGPCCDICDTQTLQ